jgi:hypothetical protein
MLTASAAAIALVASVSTPPAARASCAAAVVVDGVVLFGVSLETSPGRLPARGAPHAAIEPACNDTGDSDEEDRRITVRSLASMPPDVAVAEVDDDTLLYLAEGSLTALADHPLHATFYGDASRPSFRGARACRPSETVRGTVTFAGDGTRIALATREGDRTVRVDASSRVANRPAYQPVLPGQRLRLRTSVCGSRRVADRIAFTGATIHPKGYDRGSDDGGDMPLVHVIAAATLLVGIAVIVKITPPDQ